MNRSSDYINFDTALRKGNELLQSERTQIFGFYIILSINLGLRVSDVLRLKHLDLTGKKENDILILIEKKTGKPRHLTLNKHIEKSYNYLVEKLKEKNNYDEHGYIFISQKNKIYSTRSLNRILKRLFNSQKNLSTHSLRKAFGRRVYENNMRSEHSLVLLSDIFCHSSVAVTRRYLGLRAEEIGNIYISL
jgi:integrase